ncbi:MAG: M20/M25/M40 family metallo-hydrolase [Candidatus Zixiibacteriota bacterium]|nr:MAG: M20/M25/M40 family metallo-hydrolase [candidate division Zixibacteria bacterium]
MKSPVPFILGLVGVLSLPSSASSPVDADRALSSISVLASDSLQGRRSGLPGGERAAAWIAEQHRAHGLQPAVGDTSFFQPFTLTTAVESGPMVLRWIPDAPGGDTLAFAYGRDFVTFAYGGAGKVRAPLVFTGYGVQEADKGRDDLAGADLKGKIALALAGAPPGGGEGFWGREGFHGYKLAKAHENGAAGYLQVGRGQAMQRTIGLNNYFADMPSFWFSREACDRMLAAAGLTVDSLFASSNSNPSGYHLELPGLLEMESHAGVVENTVTRNVAAKVPGADPELAHEIVIVGAHMDHLGVSAIGRVYPGADDNASGTALVLELARALAADPIPPRRTVVFASFAAEELGIVGSEEFVTGSAVPRDSVVAMINMDMVGQGDEGVSLGGWPNFPHIARLWEAALPDSLQDRLVHFKPGYYSDHGPFEEVGIPAFFLASRGDHPAYHQPEDTLGGIRIETLAEVGEVVWRGMRAVADHPAPLADPDRLARYLWQSSEIVELGAPDLQAQPLDDTPDLVLYEAALPGHAAPKDPLLRVAAAQSELERRLSGLGPDRVRRVDSLAAIPTGLRVPAVIPGTADLALLSRTPDAAQHLSRLGILFLHVTGENKGKYFGAKSLRKPGRDLLRALAYAPQAIIWEAPDLTAAGWLLKASPRPLVVRLASAEGDLTGLKAPGHFLLLSPETLPNLTPARLEALAQAVGWRNLGVEADREAGLRLIHAWLDQGWTHGRIRDLLGGNFVRWLGKTKPPAQTLAGDR